MTSELDAAWEALQAVEAEVSAALAKAARVTREHRAALPADLVEELTETPVEELLRGMVEAKEQADADRKQVARLLVLVERLGLDAADVATDLAAARARADQTTGEPGAAADAGIKSP